MINLRVSPHGRGGQTPRASRGGTSQDKLKRQEKRKRHHGLTSFSVSTLWITLNEYSKENMEDKSQNKDVIYRCSMSKKNVKHTTRLGVIVKKKAAGGGWQRRRM